MIHQDILQLPRLRSPASASPVEAGGAVPPGTALPATPERRRALDDILAKRHEQIARYGHTPEQDAKTPLYHFAREVQSAAQAVMEDATFARDDRRARIHLVKLGALVLATLERLALEGQP